MFQFMLMPYRKLYALVAGRSSRSEFWWFVLFAIVVTILFVLLMVGVVGGMGALGGGGGMESLNPMMLGAGAAGAIALILPFYVFMLATGLASLAVTVRRLHDLGFTGWLLVAYYVVLFIGAMISQWLYYLIAIAFLVVMALPGNTGPNKYGPDPLVPDTGADTFA